MSQRNGTWRDLFSLPRYERKWLRLIYLKFCWPQIAFLPKVNNSIKESTNHTYNQHKARTSCSLDVCVCHILATTSYFHGFSHHVGTSSIDFVGNGQLRACVCVTFSLGSLK